MAVLLNSHTSLLLSTTTPKTQPSFSSSFPASHSLSSSVFPQRSRFRFPSLLAQSSFSQPGPNSNPNKTPNPKPDPVETVGAVTDEWGEKSDPEPEPTTKLADSDPPQNEDEWEEEREIITEEGYATSANGSAAYDRVEDLKRCLVDTVYGTNFGYQAGSEVRAEVLELVNQLEAANPTSAPVEAPELLDGNWVLVYTAFSELVPLLAAGGTPFLKVEKITQSINSRTLEIVNATKLSSPFATFSFSASATFEARSSTRIQVGFKEGVLQPPEVKSSIDLPEDVEIFGQRINLSPLQQSLGPLQAVAESISRVLSGQPPLKIPIPGNQNNSSWLLITYLDQDLRISRGDGGLFVLVKQNSPLLDQ